MGAGSGAAAMGLQPRHGARHALGGWLYDTFNDYTGSMSRSLRSAWALRRVPRGFPRPRRAGDRAEMISPNGASMQLGQLSLLQGGDGLCGGAGILEADGWASTV